MFQVIGESAVEELPNLVQLHQDPNQLTLAQVNGKYGLLGQAFYLSIKMLLVINPPKKTDKGKISRPGSIRMLELNCFFFVVRHWFGVAQREGKIFEKKKLLAILL